MPTNRKADRAKQFLPFDALKGFREALAQKERIIVDRVDLNEDDLRRLSVYLRQVKKGQIIKVIYYARGEYLALEGMVSTIDYDSRFVRIVKTRISFEDLRQIQGEGIMDDEMIQ